MITKILNYIWEVLAEIGEAKRKRLAEKGYSYWYY